MSEVEETTITLDDHQIVYLKSLLVNDRRKRLRKYIGSEGFEDMRFYINDLIASLDGDK